MTTLITFIGRPEANRDYRSAHYRFDNGMAIQSRLFAAAAIQWLAQTNRKPSRLIVIGTPRSGWDVLMELVEQLAQERAIKDDAVEWAIPLSEALAAGADPIPSLRDFEQRFSAAIDMRLDLVVAENDGDSVFATLAAALSANEQVILDITHSFRSMPVHALIALGAMRWLKGVELSDIIYGSLDERDAEGISAARSLGASAALARATPALAQLVLSDDVGGIAPYLAPVSPEVKEKLVSAHQLESMMQYAQAGAPRKQALGLLRKLEGAPTTCAVAARVQETLESLDLGQGSKGLLERARRAFARSDYMRTIGLANEALLLRVVELRNLRECAERELQERALPPADFYSVINRLAREALKLRAAERDAPRNGTMAASDALRTLASARNAVMHAGGGVAGQRGPRELLSLDELRALLKWSFRFYDFLT